VAAAANFAAFAAHEVESDETTVHIGFLKSGLSAEAARQMIACRTPVDEFAANGREFYWLCRIPTHESKVWASSGIKALKIPTMTMRNLAMLRRLTVAFPA
jgi:uncharacterized protein (DUF1697 family)